MDIPQIPLVKSFFKQRLVCKKIVQTMAHQESDHFHTDRVNIPLLSLYFKVMFQQIYIILAHMTIQCSLYCYN